MKTNVYYLPPAAPEAERAGRLSPTLRLRLGLLAFWVRLRLTVAELHGVLRRFGRPPVDADALLLDPRADLVLAVRPAHPRPARIIDFVAARARLRP
jgi:hypothetical protein